MSNRSRLPVVLLWHMHQPQYRDALTGQYALPWTYLHAIKDYTDMAAHLEAQPTARAVVNFTPVLLEQLDELAQKIAAHLKTGRALPDPVLNLLSAESITTNAADRLELLKACLRAQRVQMVERFGPYLELTRLAEAFASLDNVRYLSDTFLHDIAMWYHIAWLGETVRRGDARVAGWMAQGRDFSAGQRCELLALISELIAGVIPRFRLLSERGQCELSMTPYAHPLVPLLIDFKSAREAIPTIALPQHERYPGGAARANWHLEHGLEVFSKAFGVRPLGCWPAEGAVSEESYRLYERCGFRWIASSSGVLRASLEASGVRSDEASHRAYTLGGGALRCFFRDDGLSDRIGFTYATWHGDDAARNLVAELAELARRHAPGGQHAVLIALDGENAWEHYPFNGYYFLRGLYAGIAAHPDLELVTLGDCVARGLAPLDLPRLTAGSWVHASFATWMGDVDKNAAWDLLCEAKQAFDRVMGDEHFDALRRAAAEQQLALCESSDWFWWFGDYNPAEAVRQFDELYRRQLRVLYSMLGLAPPERLNVPLSIGRGAPEHGGAMRRAS